MIRNLKSISPFNLFVIKAIGLFILWVVVVKPFLILEGGGNDLVTVYTGETSCLMLRLVGFDSYVEIIKGKVYLLVASSPIVFIGNGCNALTIMALFVGFVIAYPGPYKSKAIFIVLGMALVFLMNALRVLSLGLNMIYHQTSFEFNHKYTFTFMVYAVVFILWMLWANKFSSDKLQTSKG